MTQFWVINTCLSSLNRENAQRKWPYRETETHGEALVMMKSRKYSTLRLNYSRGPALGVHTHTHTQMWALMWWEGLRHALLSEECVGGQWAKTNGVLARRSSAVKQRLRVQTLRKYNRRSDSSHIPGNLLSPIRIWCHPNTDWSTCVPFIWLSTSSAEAPLGFKGRTPTAFKVKNGSWASLL